MKVAVVGSRGIMMDLSKFIPEGTSEIISGGARGVDSLAEEYAREHGIPARVFRPDYRRYGKGAPFVRNRQIVDACDQLIAIWDGKSRGTQYTVHYARKMGKPVRIYLVEEE